MSGAIYALYYTKKCQKNEIQVNQIQFSGVGVLWHISQNVMVCHL